MTNAHTDRDFAYDAVIALMRNPVIPAARLMVTVDHGHITLTGTVDSQLERETALRAIRDLAHVCDVTDHVVVQPTGRMS